MRWRISSSSLIPYTTLFRSCQAVDCCAHGHAVQRSSYRVTMLMVMCLVAIPVVVLVHFEIGLRCALNRTVSVPQVSHLRKSGQDRKSTRLNSSHLVLSYAVL